MFCLEATVKEKRQCAGAKGGLIPTYTVWRYEDVILEISIMPAVILEKLICFQSWHTCKDEDNDAWTYSGRLIYQYICLNQ